MLINGVVEYSSKTFRKEEVEMDTSNFASVENKDLIDAVAYALYGKTVYQELIRPETGLPMVYLVVSAGELTFSVVRKPSHVFCGRTLPELFMLGIGDNGYNTFPAEEFFARVQELTKLPYEDFVASCR